MGLTTELPPVLIPLCLLLGAVYSWLLYRRDLKREKRTTTLVTMVVFRFLSVSIIAFLLLSPLIQRREKSLEKPIVVIGIDNSTSIATGGDSAFYTREFPALVEQTVEKLNKSCEVRTFTFGEKVTENFSPGFTGRQTNISEFLKEVDYRFSNRNVAAVILASDGIYNSGTDPYYASRKITFPLYTVALGDTNLKKDLAISRAIANRRVFLNDRFPIEVQVDMNKCRGLNSRLQLLKQGVLLDSRNLKATSEQQSQRITFWVDAKNAGMSRYELRLDSLEGEVTFGNNRAGLFVEVLDSRQKIAIRYLAPHPDIMAIRAALASASRFEVETFKAGQPLTDPSKYDLVIQHQLPSISSLAETGNEGKSGVPVLFILGSLSDINAFNRFETGLVINSNRNSFSESEPVLNESFSVFTLDKRDKILLDEYPPLLSPFGTYQAGPLSEVFLYQTIAGVTTRTPLVIFTRNGDKKFGIIAGENIWRWRISNFQQENNTEQFDRMFEKIVMYLAAKEDKSFFRIHTRPRFMENEQVEMEAEVFNPSYQRITDPDVNVTITNADGKTFPFLFSRNAEGYFLRAGLFPAGSYKYLATTKAGRDNYQRSGEFVVQELNAESASLVADFNLLYRMAVAHDGEMVPVAGMPGLAEKILQREDTRTIASYQSRIADLIGSPLLFLLILALLSVEWILRKREGK